MKKMHVEIISANEKLEVKKRERLRVAAYCRVSTDDEEQITSFKNQIAFYTDKIMQNPKWDMVGIFADEGITGTSTKHRKEFNKLIGLCDKGKVDLIITKSTSRFARNTLDAISIVRKLKEQNVGVLFENQGINTLEMTDEMVFTIFAAQAQAESEAISKNVAWGKRQSFKQGNVYFQYGKTLGYEKGEDGKPKINEHEAEIVRRIFHEYISGLSLTAIMNNLDRDEVPNASGVVKWSQSTIKYMLSNEKYIGDALLQKTYIENCLTKKVKVNNGELPKYYVHNHHAPIIDKELFYRVQEEMVRRGSKRRSSQKAKTEHGKYSGKYALTERLYCGKCGTRYKRVTWYIKGSKKVVWRCISRVDYGLKYCSDSPSIDEIELHAAIIHAINKVDKHKDEFLGEIKDNIAAAISIGGVTDSVYAHQMRIKELGDGIMNLIAISDLNGSEGEGFEAKIKAMSDEIRMHKERIAEIEALQDSAGSEADRLNEIYETLDSEDLLLTEYDDMVVRKLIEVVRVDDEDTITVTFNSGIVITEKLRKGV